MTIETMDREFRYDNLRLPDPNQKPQHRRSPDGLLGDVSGNRHRERDGAGGRRQQARLLLYESDRHQGMSKKRVLEELRRVIDGTHRQNKRDRSGVQDMSAVPAMLPNSVAGLTAGRLRPTPVRDQDAVGACPPWLIARGHSLEVPRLDRVPLHHCSFGSDCSRGAICLRPYRSRHREPRRLETFLEEPDKFLQRTLDRFIREHGEKEN